MQLEQQVCSLEIAKLLKELGVKQESLFIFQNWKQEGSRKINIELELATRNPLTNEIHSPNGYVSAFTVAELGDILPDSILRGKGENNSFFQFDFDKGGRKYDIRYVHWIEDGQLETDFSIRGNTEANARGKMLIYLLENKLITL